MQTATKRAAIYARSATIQELTPGFPTDAQVNDCTQYILSKGYQLIGGQVYTETASGANIDRPGVAALCNAAKRGEFDVLVVYALNRLSRSPSKAAVLLATLEGYGVHVESITEPNGDSGVDAAYTQMVITLHQQVTILEKEARSRRRNAGSPATE